MYVAQRISLANPTDQWQDQHTYVTLLILVHMYKGSCNIKFLADRQSTVSCLAVKTSTLQIKQSWERPTRPSKITSCDKKKLLMRAQSTVTTV